MSHPLADRHDLERLIAAEQAVLGSMLLSPDVIPDITAVLDPGAYYRPAHETIHRAIVAMHDAGAPVDPITLAAHLERTGDLTRVGGHSYVHQLPAAAPSAMSGEYYAEIVADAAATRRLETAGMRLMQQTREGHDPDALRAEVLADLQNGDRRTWPAPLPLGETKPLPTFPVETLPDWVRDQVAAVAEFTQTPPDLAATMALAALSTAAGGRVHAQIRPGWTEQSNLFLVCAMPPASRKSDVFAAMTAPIYRIENELADAARPAIIEAQTAREAAEAEAEGLLAKARKADVFERANLVAEATAARMLAEDIHVPPTPRLTVSGDVTPEPLTHLLGTHRCLAALSPEGDLFDIIAGRYSSRPNLGVFLQAHKGERLQTDRITREQPSVDRPALTIGVTPQPAVLQDLAGAHGARDRGLLARFLFALPPSNLGYRRVRTTPVPEQVSARYDSRLEILVRTLVDLPESVTIELNAEADTAVERLQEELEPKLRPDQPLSHVPDWAGKLVGATVRIAALLHLADRITTGWGQPISADHVHRAATIADYYTDHALAVFDLIAADPATDDARAVLDWLTRPTTKGPRHSVRRRDVITSLRRFRGKTDLIDPALRLLEEHGYLRADTPGGTTAKGGRPGTVTYRVHPGLSQSPDAT
ncbi:MULTISPECIES: YfjI family protein [unclassified Streptomyces]|uniref:YfjI family protein n=1 Tax=unclassified Streptomyces TaxID=2593676 RepID=UPI000CD4E670|nr:MULTISPECIES: YfjI family protein [unclassified Streptomyces]